MSVDLYSPEDCWGGGEEDEGSGVSGRAAVCSEILLVNLF